MNKNIIQGLIAVGILTSISSAANVALDFSGVTSAVDASTMVAAIAAIAAIKILPGVARWGFSKVISWFA